MISTHYTNLRIIETFMYIGSQFILLFAKCLVLTIILFINFLNKYLNNVNVLTVYI